jgi:carotenoid cleavage dioxygenase-like enzyme
MRNRVTLESPYARDDTHGARLGVLPREGADCDVRWIEIELCLTEAS